MRLSWPKFLLFSGGRFILSTGKYEAKPQSSVELQEVTLNFVFSFGPLSSSGFLLAH